MLTTENALAEFKTALLKYKNSASKSSFQPISGSKMIGEFASETGGMTLLYR